MSRIANPTTRALGLLAEESVLWLSAVRDDGHPHLVPTWFVWDGRTIISFSKPGAVKVRCIAADPRVMIGLGSPLHDFDVQLIEGRARLLDRPTDRTLAAPVAEKYAFWLAAARLSVDEFIATYAQPIEITPVRFLGWQGRTTGRTRAAAVAALSAASGRPGSRERRWRPARPSRPLRDVRPMPRDRGPRPAFGTARGPAWAATGRIGPARARHGVGVPH
jgi:PPOX class probable F420-dependent enzyme